MASSGTSSSSSSSTTTSSANGARTATAIVAVAGSAALLTWLAIRRSQSGKWSKSKNATEEDEEYVDLDEEEASDDDGPIRDLEDYADGPARPDRLGIGEVLRWFGRKAPQDQKQRRCHARGRCASSEVEGASYLPGSQRVFVRTYGCPHNASDGEYMMGQLRDYGYTLVDSIEDCDVCVINSCTVKHPSETRAMNMVTNSKQSGKAIVLAGCVPASDRKLAESLEGVSVLDVTQLDRIVDVVEESLKGHTVKLLQKRKDLPSLALPKVRKDQFAEIITINAGCLGSCTFCKTKHARGKVVSYSIDEIVARAKQAAAEGVCQIELASEDMGAYGVDIGTDIVQLLKRLSDELPPGVMLRTGMTNPPYIMQHIDGIIEVLKRPNVHAFMHIPVQTGSDAVLLSMRREYTIAEFCHLADRLKEAIPDMFLLSDIICGFPSESEEDWQATMELCKKYRFQGLHVSQFYARPGTPAAKLKPLKSKVIKDRWRELTDLTNSYNRNEALEGKTERVWFTGTENERGQSIGRTKNFAKVLVARDDKLLGKSAMVQLGKSSKLHVEGTVIGPAEVV
mmetsp:Transcript_11562/g.25427  ORF Transcript_11562/g.25427 Transcript_11562/m.25427 type:complete len:568 (+) Transcript_11562:43-1746(+)